MPGRLGMEKDTWNRKGYVTCTNSSYTKLKRLCLAFAYGGNNVQGLRWDVCCVSTDFKSKIKGLL